MTLGGYYDDNQNFNTYMMNEMAMKIRDDLLMELPVYLRATLRDELQYLFPSKGANVTPEVEADVKFDAKQIQEAFEEEVQRFQKSLKRKK